MTKPELQTTCCYKGRHPRLSSIWQKRRCINLSVLHFNIKSWHRLGSNLELSAFNSSVHYGHQVTSSVLAWQARGSVFDLNRHHYYQNEKYVTALSQTQPTTWARDDDDDDKVPKPPCRQIKDIFQTRWHWHKRDMMYCRIFKGRLCSVTANLSQLPGPLGGIQTSAYKIYVRHVTEVLIISANFFHSRVHWPIDPWVI